MIFKKKNSGFSLIELLVVVGIIALLTTVVMVSISRSKAKSRDAVRLAKIKTIQQGAEGIFVETGKIPTSWSGFGTYFLNSGASSIPKDPQGRNFSYRVFTDANGISRYCIGTKLEIPKPSPSGCSTGTDDNYKIQGP